MTVQHLCRSMVPLLIGLWGVGATPAQGVFPGQAWQEAAPDSQGVDAAKLKAAVGYLDANFGEQGARELVIVRNGCNFCIVLPEWNMVIVRMGTVTVAARDGRNNKFNGFFARIGEALRIDP